MIVNKGRELVMIWDKAAVLNHKGYELFGKIFTDSLVPVKSSISIRTNFLIGRKKVETMMVDIQELQEKTPDKWRALLQLLSQIHGDPEEDLVKHYDRYGLPLRLQLVSEVVYKKFYSAWEIEEALEELLGEPLEEGPLLDWSE